MSDPVPSKASQPASDPNYPSLNGQSKLESSKDSFSDNTPIDAYKITNTVADTQAALNTIQTAPLTQNVKNTVSKASVVSVALKFRIDHYLPGPVAEGAKAQYTATQDDFKGLADSRQTPTTKAATGQQLTHYHSMFYSLLSWENPRATAVTFLVNVLFIFAARYLNIIRYLFKVLYFTLGVTASAELAGKTLFSSGFTSQMRPKKYYVIPKDTLELVLDDVQELINFFVIEFQRIVFAENVGYTLTAFAASFSSYLLIKFVPFWGLSLIGTCTLYLAPLIYVNNKALIDAQVANASDVVSKQATQIKDIAGHHTAQATGTMKTYASDYTSKAQQYIGTARGRTGSPLDKMNTATTSSSSKLSGASTTRQSYQSTDFPVAPKANPTPIANEFSGSKLSEEPLIAT